MQYAVRIWVCPSCGNYFGSSSSEGLLEQAPVNSRVGHEDRDRRLCPDCGDMRVECVFGVELVPKAEGPTTAPAA